MYEQKIQYIQTIRHNYIRQWRSCMRARRLTSNVEFCRLSNRIGRAKVTFKHHSSSVKFTVYNKIFDFLLVVNSFFRCPDWPILSLPLKLVFKFFRINWNFCRINESKMEKMEEGPIQNKTVAKRLNEFKSMKHKNDTEALRKMLREVSE